MSYSSRTGLLIAIGVLMMATIRVGGQRTEVPPQQQRIPTGFMKLDAKFWSTPWVFEQDGSTATALPALHNSMGQLTNGPLAVRLDDGTSGILRVQSRCTVAYDCASENYRIEVVSPDRKPLARTDVYLAYGVFDIVPVDLVDGPGDELMIVKILTHSVPPQGHDLQIWKLEQARLVALMEPLKVANRLGTIPMGCALWRAHVFVNPTASKPRPLVLRSESAAGLQGFDEAAVCRVDEDEVTTMKSARVLYFERGKYRH